MRLDENFSDLEVVKSYFESLCVDWFKFWDSTRSHGKVFYVMFALLAIFAYKTDPYSILAVLVSPVGWIIIAIAGSYFVVRWLENNNKYHRLALNGLNEFHFSRKTGKAVAPWGEFPFYEFDAYITQSVSLLGDRKHSLNIIHRYPNKSRSQSAGQTLDFIVEVEGGIAEHQAVWDMLCRYMDVSQPLPDIPQLEPFRALDVTTRNYDEKGNRAVEGKYWENFYERDGWQELDEAKASHRLFVNNTNWKGRDNIMAEKVPDYLSIEKDLNLEIRSDDV